jgi:hypothetical protein
MRFTSAQDFQLMQHFNRELINTFIDTPVVLYKLNIVESKKNVYGESSTKRWYRGVQIPSLIQRDLASTFKDLQTVNIEQTAKFHFLRSECELRNVSPEQGDIILYNNLYFEADNINEIQLIAGQAIYPHALIVSAHLTRSTTLQLEQPIL